MTEIRELRDDETPFIEEMLCAALAWRPGVELPRREFLLAHAPPGCRLPRGLGPSGRRRLVAEEAGEPIGLVWYRFFTDEAHGEA
jgi:hypothetical protein